MKIQELMTEDVEAVEHDATLEEAAYLMMGAGVGFLPVIKTEKVVGVVTDRDIVTRAVARGLDSAATRVRDVMTSQAVFCREDDDVEQAKRLMSECRFRRLVVVDGDGLLAGILSVADLERFPEGVAKKFRKEEKPSMRQQAAWGVFLAGLCAFVRGTALAAGAPAAAAPAGTSAAPAGTSAAPAGTPGAPNNGNPAQSGANPAAAQSPNGAPTTNPAPVQPANPNFLSAPSTNPNFVPANGADPQEVGPIRGSLEQAFPRTPGVNGAPATGGIAHLRVAYQNGKVVLRGTVGTQEEKDAATAQAAGLAGGAAYVDNEMTVQ